MSRFQTALLILLCIAVLYVAQTVFIPLVLAAMLAMLLSGPVQRLERWRVPRVVAVTVCVAMASGIIVGIGWLVGVQVINLANNLPAYQGEIRYKLQAIRGSGGGAADTLNKVQQFQQAIADNSTTTRPSSQPSTQSAAATQPGPATRGIGEFPAAVRSAVEALPEAARASTQPANRPPETATVPSGTEQAPLFVYALPPPESAVSAAARYLGLTLGPLGTAGLVLVFVFFILLEREDLRDRIIRLVSNGKLTVTTTAVDDGITRVLKFMRAQAIVNGTYGIAVAIGLCLISLTLDEKHDVFPSFLIWGLLAAVLRFVPYVGPWIAATFPIVVSLAAFHGFMVPVAVISMFVVIEVLSNNIMEPMLYGSSTGLSTMAVLVSAVFWTWLWGPIGLVLATPLTVCLMVLGRHAPPLRFLEVLLGDRPAMSHNERVYQRLLADDEDEAAVVVNDYFKEHGLAATYDEVLLPALYMCEQDDAQGLLEADRAELVRDGLRTIIGSLGRETLAENFAAASGNRGPCARIAILPARDEADELAGAMIANLLRQEGCEPMALSHNALAAEMVDVVTQFKPHVICISAMPPAAVSHVRYLLRRLDGKLTGQQLNLAVWRAKTDLPTLRRQIDMPQATLTTSLQETKTVIARMTEAVQYEANTGAADGAAPAEPPLPKPATP
jgi:predicted PurR-regulated permease PerM